MFIITVIIVSRISIAPAGVYDISVISKFTIADPLVSFACFLYKRQAYVFMFCKKNLQEDEQGTAGPSFMTRQVPVQAQPDHCPRRRSRKCIERQEPADLYRQVSRAKIGVSNPPAPDDD